MKKCLKVFVILFVVILLSGCKNSVSNNSKFTIISTNFPGYDFARAITKDVDNVEVKLLLKTGAEMHHYEPTPQDIIDIKNSDVFIYVGGESDSWISNILNDIDTSKTKIIKLMDLVDLSLEGDWDNSETDEYDEHVWTSPVNAIQIVKKLSLAIIRLDIDNQELYQKNTDSYVNLLALIDTEIRSIVENAKRNELVFGDRFPLIYFTKEYGLKYYAAFPGCSEQTEASAKTLAFLINKVKEDSIPVVLHVELTKGDIANSISKETGAKVMEFSSIHNISQSDFDKGITYVDIMKKNIEVLKVALN